MTFCVLLLELSTMVFEAHPFSTITSFLCMAEYYAIEWLYHILIIQMGIWVVSTFWLS